MFGLVFIVFSGIVAFLFGYLHRRQQTCPIFQAQDHAPNTHASLTSTIQCTTQSGRKNTPCHAFVNDLKLRTVATGFIPTTFSNLKHASSPAHREFLLAYNHSKLVGYDSCSRVYVTVTGSRKNQPNKCQAIAYISSHHRSNFHINHRFGNTALKLNQFMKDVPSGESYQDESRLLPTLLNSFDEIIQQFKKQFGDGKNANGQHKTMVVMVINEGVLDIFLNLVCSLKGSHVDTSNFVIFIGNLDYKNLLENFGFRIFYNPKLGYMPKQAAEYYLDDTFKQMMWFKMIAVYIPSYLGYNVLFQDVDLVWLKDPFSYLEEIDADMIFMDDGARGSRYAPLYSNSGFYFVKATPKSLYVQELMLKAAAAEIGTFHSHQAVLSKHILESIFLFDLKIHVLDKKLFPSGKLYHDERKYIVKILNHEVQPYVFHMCWTTNKREKVRNRLHPCHPLTLCCLCRSSILIT